MIYAFSYKSDNYFNNYKRKTWSSSNDIILYSLKDDFFLLDCLVTPLSKSQWAMMKNHFFNRSAALLWIQTKTLISRLVLYNQIRVALKIFLAELSTYGGGGVKTPFPLINLIFTIFFLSTVFLQKRFFQNR